MTQAGCSFLFLLPTNHINIFFHLHHVSLTSLLKKYYIWLTALFYHHILVMQNRHHIGTTHILHPLYAFFCVFRKFLICCNLNQFRYSLNCICFSFCHCTFQSHSAFRICIFIRKICRNKYFFWCFSNFIKFLHIFFQVFFYIFPIFLFFILTANCL